MNLLIYSRNANHERLKKNSFNDSYIYIVDLTMNWCFSALMDYQQEEGERVAKSRLKCNLA